MLLLSFLVFRLTWTSTWSAQAKSTFFWSSDRHLSSPSLFMARIPSTTKAQVLKDSYFLLLTW